jgi:hypothetical protein
MPNFGDYSSRVFQGPSNPINIIKCIQTQLAGMDVQHAPNISMLSSLSDNLGSFYLGNFFSGSGDPLGGTFTGGALSSPGYYDATTGRHYVVYTLNAGMLQCGMSTEDGAFICGGGAGGADVDGFWNLRGATYTDTASYKFLDASGANVGGVSSQLSGGYNWVKFSAEDAAKDNFLDIYAKGVGAFSGVQLRTDKSDAIQMAGAMSFFSPTIYLQAATSANNISMGAGFITLQSTLVTILGKAKINCGTTFPLAPAAGDVYFRTDLGFECYYDGTRWLTTHEYAESVTTTLFTANGNALASQARSDYAIYVTRVAISTDVLTTNNGTNYWTVTVRGLNAALTATTLLTFTTAADTVNVFTNHEAAPATNTPANRLFFDVLVAKTLTPGNIYTIVTIYYRLIVT